jgi:hypothetical protein
VIRELIVTLLKSDPAGKHVRMDVVCRIARERLAAHRLADETDAVSRQLLTLLPTLPPGWSKVHDANIVATMLVNGIPRLLTNNAADFAAFGNLIEIVSLDN